MRFEDIIFEGNGGLIIGVVYLCNVYIIFERCIFWNNFVVDNFGYIYFVYGIG